jgi:pimeloyl-ACP methyl ester carboxylesterase
MSDLRLIRGASPSRYGGIHWYEWKPKDEALMGPETRELLLLHPLSGDGAYFHSLAPFLAAGRTVISADYPGHGRSDPLEESPSVGHFADAMLDLMRARNTPGRADLLGCRGGCLVAAEMALREPGRVHRLVLIDVLLTEAGEDTLLDYPAEERLTQLQQPVLVLATDPERLESNRRAAGVISGSQLRELGDVEQPAVEHGAAGISAATLEFLDA